MVNSQVFIKIESITKQYTGDQGTRQVLKGISLDVYQGEILGFLGVNGAGKTTLTSIIATLHPATSGDIIWKGKSVFDDLLNYRKIIGFCPQKPNLDASLTLEENLDFAARYHGMHAAQIKPRIDELAQKFNLTSYLKSQAHVLSGGFKQRFLIARALMHHPKLVILDEPTVGLDPQVRHQLWQVISNLKKEGVTILLATHYLDEAEALSDRVCIIDAGSIVTIDTPEKLKKLHQKQNLEEVFLKLTQSNEERL